MPTADRWGALPEEWEHFSVSMGLTADLLPVVSNPKAQKSEHSNLKGLGKTPSIYNRERRVAGFAKWTQYEATKRDIERWSAERDYGLCVQTRTLRGIDVDVDDPTRALAIACYLARELGVSPSALPVRFRANSGRLLIPVHVAGDMPKSIVRLRDGGAIEFLGTGQQFVAAGVHSSGERYLWSTLEALLDSRVGLA